jgi:hypothetical protein
MKRLIFAVMAIFASLNMQAQNIHLDVNKAQAYAEIVPKGLDFLKGDVNATRVYVKVTDFDLVTRVGFHWSLQYEVWVDSSNHFYKAIMEGDGYRPVTLGATIEQARGVLFNYVADSLGLDIEYK